MNSIDTEHNSGSPSEACSSNRRHELASATPKKCAGRKIFKETRHPVYRGVRGRNNNKWVCEVRVPNDKTTRIWLGTHSTPEMAARAHDVAALALRGEFACLNFADSAWRIPPLLPASNSPTELRRVAMEVAQAFAVEDMSCQQQQQTNNYGEVSGDSAGVVSVMEVEDDNIINNNNNNDQIVPGVSWTGFEEGQVGDDWLRSMEDEPLRSPPHIPFEGSYGGFVWNDDYVDVESGDFPEVSLWSF